MIAFEKIHETDDHKYGWELAEEGWGKPVLTTFGRKVLLRQQAGWDDYHTQQNRMARFLRRIGRL